MPVSDKFEASASAIDAPYSEAVAVTPSDSADLTWCTRALVATGAGNVAVYMKHSTTSVTLGISAGSPLPVRVDRVLSTGTTATGIVALR